MIIKISVKLSILLFLCKQIHSQETVNYSDFDLQILNGVKLDPSLKHNYETFDLILQSSPGCPPPFEQNPWLYYSKRSEEPKCHLVGVQGPCPENMIFFGTHSSPFGYCDCNCDEYGNWEPFYNKSVKKSALAHQPRGFCLGNVKDTREKRTLVYVKEWDSCHPLFEQASCPPDQWLIFGDNPLLGPHCEPRKCPIIKDKFSFYDFKTGKCHVLNDPCGNTTLTGERMTPRFGLWEGNWSPICTFRVKYASYSFTPEINPNSCAGKGEVYSKVFKKCVQKQLATTYSAGGGGGASQIG